MASGRMGWVTSSIYLVYDVWAFLMSGMQTAMTKLCGWLRLSENGVSG